MLVSFDSYKRGIELSVTAGGAIFSGDCQAIYAGSKEPYALNSPRTGIRAVQ
jgi:hypothetical protein